MTEIPTLRTARLVLRAFHASDAPAVQSYASDKTIAATTLNIPHPYTLEMAEIGYWIGKPHWGKGYCTEAVTALVQYGFDSLGFERIFATHFRKNPASGRVMQKAGMKFEGRLRHHVKKWGEFYDLEVYSLLRSRR